MKQRTIDLALSVLGSTAAFFLSWPFWRDFSYGPESEIAWYVHFGVGFILAVYVFFMFIGSLRILFLHDEQQRAAQAFGQQLGQQPTGPVDEAQSL